MANTMNNDPRRSPAARPTARPARPAGKRFADNRRTPATGVQPYRPSSYSSGRPAASAHRRTAQRQGGIPVGGIVGGVVALVAIALIVCFVVPAVRGMFVDDTPAVEAGQEVHLTIPEGASGDTIAQLMAQNHVIDNPKDYYAAVTAAGAEASIKPGEYLLYTGQDPAEVVEQLVAGPNAGTTLVIQEGLTVAQTAARVEETYGISADEFLEQAKASNYVDDYPFLEGAYNDSLEGYLYPKTYSISDPTADSIIRALLDQFASETASLDLDAGPAGLSAQEVITVASLVERETAVADERPTVASVIYNRLDIDMPLQIDAAIVYARGGGSDPVTYDDLEIDSPYNVYKNYGLPPGPICSPSLSSIQAALAPDDTDYLYYVASAAGDGTHRFTDDYAEFEQFSQEYGESLQ